MPYFWIADFCEPRPKISESPKLFADGFISKWGGKFGSPMVIGGLQLVSSRLNNQDKVLFQFTSHVMWGKASIAIQIPGRYSEFESKTPTRYLL